MNTYQITFFLALYVLVAVAAYIEHRSSHHPAGFFIVPFFMLTLFGILFGLCSLYIFLGAL
jgi:hypothetical protein